MNKPTRTADLTPFQVTTGALPGSRKVFVSPDLAPDLQVPLREIVLSPESGEAPLRVYDPSGPYTDANVAHRRERWAWRVREAWVIERGGVERYDGRAVKPEDNGSVTGRHAAREFPIRHQPLRGLGGKAAHAARIRAGRRSSRRR